VSEPNNFFFIAFDGAEAVGYVKLKDGASPPALENISSLEIARIYVSKKSIGNGIGRLLMEQCIAFAKEKNKELLWLGVWEKNQRAIDFYQRWGFEKFSDHYFQLGDDIQQDWLMKKKL
jgi:ribosomal protein S18 acetylase RimI-like enzyme